MKRSPMESTRGDSVSKLRQVQIRTEHRSKKSKFISLFSGAMGLDIGLERAGFTCVACNEIDPLAIETVRANKPTLPIVARSAELLSREMLSEAAGFEVRDIDLVVGGPPCQAFSVFGQRRGLRDGRGRLIFEFQRVVGEVMPKIFLMENVRGLHSMPLMPTNATADDVNIPAEHKKPGSLLRELVRGFEAFGYHVDCYLVNAVNYGAPQIRERLLCIGNRFGLEAKFPIPRFSNRHEDALPPFRTLRDAIGNGFADPDPSIMNFSARKLRYLAMVPPGGNWRSLPLNIQKESMGKSWYLKGGRSAYWRKLSWDFPSPTVVTMPNHAGTSMCHPDELRALTVGEMAAIQEFPCDWIFSGSATDKCRQIGNAVPPRLGEVAGEAVMNLLFRCNSATPPKEAKRSTSKVIHLRPHVRTRTYFKNGEAKSGSVSYYDEKQSVTQLRLRLEERANRLSSG